MRPIAFIVTDWERLGKRQVAFEIRDNVTFHSGSELTPEDVAFSINRANNPEVSSQAGVIGPIDEARVEETRVVVDLLEVFPAVFNTLTGYGRVVEKEWIESRDQGEISTHMNGTGAFELKEFKEDSSVVFQKYENYWGDDTDVKTGTFNAVADTGTRVNRLETGASDIVTSVSPQFVSRINDTDGITTQTIPSFRIILGVMNDAYAPFDSLKFRQALNYAIDTEAIIDSILDGFGRPTGQLTLPEHVGHNPEIEPYPYDPDRAESLIENSGHVGEKITLHSPTGRYVRDTDVAESVAGQINELSNVSAETELRDTSALIGEWLSQDQNDAPGFFIMGSGNPTFDASLVLNAWFTEGPVSMFNNEKLAKVVKESNQNVKGSDRQEKLHKANRLSHELAPFLYLHQEFLIYGQNEEIDWNARPDENILFRLMSKS
jgi:peptide/nickel transport system substrate-binding protein